MDKKYYDIQVLRDITVEIWDELPSKLKQRLLSNIKGVRHVALTYCSEDQLEKDQVVTIPIKQKVFVGVVKGEHTDALNENIHYRDIHSVLDVSL